MKGKGKAAKTSKELEVVEHASQEAARLYDTAEAANAAEKTARELDTAVPVGNVDGGAGKIVVPKTTTANDNSLVGQLEPGNPRSSSLIRNGDRLVLNQGDLSTCGPNSCAMVLDTSGRSFDLKRLIADSKVTSQGAYMGDMAKALRNQGLDTARIKRVSIDELAEATSKGHPAIVATRLDRGGHAVVVDGISTRQGNRVVDIRDPALGWQYFTPLSEFKERFSGQAILTNPKRP